MKVCALIVLALLSWRVMGAVSVCSTASALGPVPAGDGGWCFSVWAPHAATATIKAAGSSTWPSVTMSRNATSGVFAGFVAQAQPGDGFVYVFNGNLTRLDPRAQDADPGLTYSVLHDPSFDWSSVADFVPVPANESVIMEIHVPSFNALSGKAGTFDTVQLKLPYLASLGVTAIELLPVGSFDGAATGWGYNPAAPFAVMAQFGGSAGLKSLVRGAAKLGIGVILDVVWNHFDPSGGILKDYDGFAGPSGNGVYFYESGDAVQTPWGPRPAYATPEVADFIVDSIRTFVTEYHVSGFRWDATVCIRKPGASCWSNPNNLIEGWKLLQVANDVTHQLLPSATTVAEDDQGWIDICLPTSDAHAGLPGAPGGAGFDGQWGYRSFYYTFEAQLTLLDNSNVNMGTVASVVATSSEGSRVLFTENHDMASNQNKGRIPNIVDPGGNPHKPTYWAQKKAMMGISAIMIGPGIPMLLQGQAMLTYATFSFPTPPALDWSLASANAGIVKEVTDLIGMRRNLGGRTPALSSPEAADVIQVVDTSTDKVAAVARSSGTNHVVAVLNWYEKEYPSFIVRNLPANGAWTIVFNGDSQDYSPLYANFGVNQTSVFASNGQASLMLPAYSMVVLTIGY